MTKKMMALLLALLLAFGAVMAEASDAALPTDEAVEESAETATGETEEVADKTETEETEDEAAGTGEESEEPVEQKRLSGVKIGIDPGHQAHGNSQKETVAPNSSQKKAKVSSGTQGVRTRIAEYVTVLEISMKLRDALEALGAEVYLTRETHDVDLSNQDRAKMMNELGVDLVLRIHCDGAESSKSHGIGLFVSKSNDIAAESLRAAEAILPRLIAATGAKDRGITQNDNYTGQNWSTVPCLMVECGFMSNPEEDEKLNDPDYQWQLAKGMAEGICDYIENGRE